MSKMFRPDISPSKYVFPYDISLFIETIRVVFTLLSQILGLDSDKLVTEVMVGAVCLVNQSRKEFSLNFDQFLVKKILPNLRIFILKGRSLTIMPCFF